jgi:hypothetical protein
MEEEKTTSPSKTTTALSAAAATETSKPTTFSWETYLSKTQSHAAGVHCFAQSDPPPVNEFRVGHKCETLDPRNTSSTCIATVIESQGPRLRLRLDGTDDRNDFWLMCDSELLRAWDPSHSQGWTINIYIYRYDITFVNFKNL